MTYENAYPVLYNREVLNQFDGVATAMTPEEIATYRADSRWTELGAWANGDFIDFGITYTCKTCRDTGKTSEPVCWSDGWGIATKRCPNCQ